MSESPRTNASVDQRELAFKAIAGLVGGAIGWLPVELATHGHSLTEAESAWTQLAGYASMAILAGLIGGMITAVAGQRLEITPLTKRLFIRGFTICLLLAIPETYFSNLIFTEILRGGGWSIDHPGSEAYLILARLVGWSLMGLLLGAGVGLAGLSLQNVFKGAIGGVIGGFVGGLGFDLIQGLSQTEFLSRLIGFCVLGLAIGFFIGLVQELTKTAWLAVEAGRLKGRQYRLEGSIIGIGRAEENPVGLFGDSAVEPRHAVVEKRGDRTVLRNLAVQAGSFVNGQRIETAELREGDRIRIGSYELSFHSRREPRDRSMTVETTTPAPLSSSRDAIAPSATSSRGTPCLTRIDGQRIPIRPGAAIRIGRALDNDIVVEDASVSRYHAVIEARNGALLIRDMGSQNGTFIADRRITEATLSGGDHLRLGNARFTFDA